MKEIEEIAPPTAASVVFIPNNDIYYQFIMIEFKSAPDAKPYQENHKISEPSTVKVLINIY